MAVYVHEGVPPTEDDDLAAGYPVGTIRVDEVNRRAYICVDDSTGAAVWKEITLPEEIAIKAQDSVSIDSFGRWRTSNPFTLFDSKQIFDNQPQFWDESLESGAGITSAHSSDTASSVFTSTLNTAGKYTRQTFMRFNYQPGKSQLVYLTGILGRSGGGTGVQRRIGYFDDKNGLFFEDDEGTVKVVRRTFVTGTAVDNKVAQSSWNVDVMDGTGPSGITIDWTKTQIFTIDFEWLSVGRVRMGLVIGGLSHVVHQFLNANVLDKAYMSTPNLPLRYQMITTGSSPVSTLECICATVISEGSPAVLGVLRSKSTSGTPLDANVEGTIYAVLGFRLKSTHIGATINFVAGSLAEHQGNKSFEWLAIFNPAVAGAFVYGDEPESAIQTAVGVTANTVTGGRTPTSGLLSSAQKGGAFELSIPTARLLGAAIDGTVDELVLCVRPIGGSTNLDIEATVTWRELQ